jgi:two-component system, chemotaxis family, protein-glutamate methylesterase/glutaminase
MFLSSANPRWCRRLARVLVTIHRPSNARSALDELLGLAGRLPAGFAGDGEQKGRIYVAPPSRHLLLDSDRVLLAQTGRVSIRCCVPRQMSGGFSGRRDCSTGILGEGALGLCTRRQAGGITEVQGPKGRCVFSEIARTAFNQVKPDHVTGLADLAALLDSLSLQPAEQPRPMP